MIKGKCILITGGAGFIGSHLCESLAKENQVVCLDNYSTGTTMNHVEGVTYVTGDTYEIQTKITVKPDIVFHLGEYSRVEQSFDDMALVWEIKQTGHI
jgi:UDP-glucose 4-epimerase